MIGFKTQAKRKILGAEEEWRWYEISINCPECHKLIVYFQKSQWDLPIPGEPQDLEELMNVKSAVDLRRRKEIEEINLKVMIVQWI